MYFPYDQQNGILRHFYSKDKNYFESNKFFRFSSSGSHGSYFPKYAFDFDENTYWYSDTSAKEYFISFCFLDSYVKLEKYEIHTSLSGGCIPRIWSFHGSNDNKTWSPSENVTREIETGKSAIVDWKKGIFKCFKLILYENKKHLGKKDPADLRQIELFGTLLSKHELFNTNYHNYAFNNIMIIIIIIIITEK